VVLVGLGLAAYANSFSGPFIFDDVDAILNNETIRHWSTAWWPPVGPTVSGRPVLNLSLALNYAISGTAVWSYHALNLLIHLAAGLTLFGIVRRTPAVRAMRDGVLFAGCIALLWMLHPLQTGAVTYVIQRAESLMGLFYLLTLYGFIRGTEAGGRGKNAWFGLSFAACLLGMATKEVMVSAPVIVLLYDRAFLAGTFREAFRRRWPAYAALAATWLILPGLVLSTHGREGTAGFGTGVTWWSYALAQFPAIIHYLRLSLWPHPLIFDYGTALPAPDLLVGGCALAVVGLVGATVWALVRRPVPGFLGFAFFAILAPSSSFIPITTEPMAEHRMYLPLIPVIMLVAILAWRRLGRWALPAGLVLAAVLGGLTAQRNATYATELALWTDTIAHYPANARAHHNLGVLFMAAGDKAAAITHYEEAVRLKPDYVLARDSLGKALYGEDRVAEAIAQYEQALRLNPDFVPAHFDLALALLKSPGRLDEAITQYGEVLRRQPDYFEARENLGKALYARGRVAEAMVQFEAALRLRPDSPGLHYMLALALSASQRPAEAVAQFEAALRLNPALADAHYSLAVVLAGNSGRQADVIAHYEAAVRLKPDYIEARNNLGNVLREAGRLPEAISQFEAALQLRPDLAQLHCNLALALLRMSGRTREAAAHLETALQLQPDNAMARQLLAGIPEDQR
jgi:tetratricopeptide (TPR) repeat protein